MKKLVFTGPLILIVMISLSTLCLEQTPEPENPASNNSITSSSMIETTTVKTSSTSTTVAPLKEEPSAQGLDLDEANVVAVELRKGSSGTFTFSVTVRHNDMGWEHYADWWRIKTQDGEEVARRVLAHPHVDEQPFTRSLSGVVIPAGMDRVVVEAHDSVHGYGGQVMVLELASGMTEIL